MLPSPYTIAEKRFYVDTNCKTGDARRVAGSTVRVKGCGKSALYTCVGDTCVREHTDAEIRAFSSPEVARQAPPAGVVQRTYDEQQSMHVVRAKLWMGGMSELYLLGAPKQGLTDVHMQVVMRAPAAAETACNYLRIRVNDRPFDARNVKTEPAPAAMQRVSGTLDFEIFKPLAQPYAQLSVETCGRALVAGPHQMPKLIEFFEVFSQVAVEVQSEGQPAVTPADGKTLSL